MNNQQRKYIPASDALPTKNYWIAFIIVAIIICIINYTNAYANILSYNDNIFNQDISEDEENKILTATVVDSVLVSVLACAWGIILNIALRYKTWRWRWVLLYAVTATALAIGISSLANGKFTAGSVGWIWWAIIGLYRREYVNNNLLFKPTRNMPNTQNSCIQTACPVCGKVGLPTGNKCAFCGEIIFDADRQNKTANANTDAQTHHNNSQTSNINSSFFCTKCGRKLQPEDKFCEFCGTVADTEKNRSSSKQSFKVREISDVSAPPVENFSEYYDAYKSLVDRIWPSSVNPWAVHDRKRIDFECKCFVSFLHHLATREDVYSEIDTNTYIAKFNIPTDERDAFNSRICDYLEIDMGGKTLPFLDLMLEKLNPICTQIARSCDAINYIYAFAAFAKNAKLYAASRDFKEISNLIEAANVNFFDDNFVQIFSSAIDIYNKLTNRHFFSPPKCHSSAE